jgi:hypothetical protein
VDAVNLYTLNPTRLRLKPRALVPRKMLKTTPKNAHQLSGFLRLPLELRNTIYFLVLAHSPVHVQYLQFEIDSWTRSLWETTNQLRLSEDLESIFTSEED